jgi:hypothetical protein
MLLVLLCIILAFSVVGISFVWLILFEEIILLLDLVILTEVTRKIVLLNVARSP